MKGIRGSLKGGGLSAKRRSFSICHLTFFIWSSPRVRSSRVSEVSFQQALSHGGLLTPRWQMKNVERRMENDLVLKWPRNSNKFIRSKKWQMYLSVRNQMVPI